jgi:hypothetical protein
VYCDTVIHYATVHPMNPELPHRFHAQTDTANSARFAEVGNFAAME